MSKPELMPPVPPFVRFVASAVPMVFDDSLSYYEALCALWKYIEGMTDVINNNATVVEEYTETVNEYTAKFTELKDYVDNYFENLDVQEEINKKLDEMVEDGTLGVLIQHILSIETITLFDSLQDLKAAESINSAVVETLGFYAKGDGGGARYYISDSGTADNIFVHALDSGKYATLANTHEFNVLQVGCKRNTEFDNAAILSVLFKSGLNNTTIYVPEGVYQTTRINYLGDNAETKGFHLIGVGKPTLKLIHPDKVKTTNGTYNEAYTISEGLDELDLIGYATVNTIRLADYRTFYYIAVSDATRLPASLVEGMVIKGKDSYTEAVISNIDKSDPDGAGTARIYLYETSNSRKRFVNFTVSGSNLNELLIVKQDLGDKYLYLRFNDNIVPSYVSANRQLKQISNGHSARIENASITYETIKYVKLNNLPKDVFTKNTYLVNSEPFEVNSYTGYTAGMINLNKYSDVTIEGIVFDGGNKEVDKYESDANNWNTIWSGDCYNAIIRDCEFNNAIMAGVQVSYAANAYQSAYHQISENFKIENCTFYNNGRGDIELIAGKNITVDTCYGNGTLDLETNGNEVVDNITISNVQFEQFTPYSPGVSSSSVNVNLSDSKFFIILAQNCMTLNMNNVMCYDLRPFKCHINASNSIFDNIGNKGIHGDEFVYMTNCSIYGLFQGLPGNNQGIGEYHIDNSTIDLGLWKEGSQVLTTLASFAVSNSVICSSTTRKRVRNNNAVMNFENVTMKNVYIAGVANNIIHTPISYFKNCNFLEVDNTVQSTTTCVEGSMPDSVYSNCYFENPVKCLYSVVTFINCVLNSTTKPALRAGHDLVANGIKTHDGSGINWNWVDTSQSGYTVKFSDVEFSSAFTSNTLGVKAGSTTPTTTNIVMGSGGYYVGDSDLALCRLYDNSGSVAVKQISFA